MEQPADELVDELGCVLHEPHRAKALLLAAGFPAAYLPAFDLPGVFWGRVIQAAKDGQVTGGVRSIVVKAAAQFQENEIFAGFLAREGAAENRSVKEPFVGLRAIGEEDSDRFFGREDETKELVEKLGRTPLVLVVGDSGSGKSSLVLAGLVPRFREGAFVEESERSAAEFLHVIKMSPRGAPRTQLGDGVFEAGEALGVQLETRKTLAGWASTGSADDVRRALLFDRPRERTQVLLVVDQFEELWTSSPKEDRSSFVDLLLDLVTSGDGRIHVVLTMRRDYANLCSEIEPLKAWLEAKGGHGRYDLRRISEAGLRLAVTEPLRRVRVGTQQREALAEVVLGDVGERLGDLALLQMALSETWSARKEHGGDLVVAYHHVGRVEGALAKAADAVRAKMGDDERAHLDAILVRLVQLGDTGGATRRLATRDEFADDRWKVVQQLASKGGKRLIVLGGGEDSPMAEISHEALVTAWPYFQQLLFEYSKDKRMLDALMPKAKAWASEAEAEAEEAKGKLLAMGVDLESFEQLLATRFSWFSASEIRFVEASVKARRDVLRAERQRQRRLVTAAATASAVLLGLLVIAGWQYFSASKARRDAERERYTAKAATISERSARASLMSRTPGKELQALDLAVRAAMVLNGEGTWSIGTDRGLFDVLPRARRIATLRVLTDGFSGMAWAPSLFTRVAWAPDDRSVATINDSRTVRLWDGRTGDAIVTLVHTDSVSRVVWAPDGTRVATASKDGIVRLWDGRTDVALATLKGHTDRVSEMAWASDGTRVATVSKDGSARLWDGRTGDAIATLESPSGSIQRVAWSPDGTRLATVREEGTVVLWNGTRGDAIATIEDSTGSVRGVTWAPDGIRLATVSNDKTARLWDGRTGDAIATLKGHTDGVSQVAWASDGIRVATASKDGTARLWDGRTGDAIAILEGHTGLIFGVAWSPDGKRVTTTSNDRTTRLWNGRTGKAIATLGSNTKFPQTLVWSPNGTSVATIDEDGMARLWDGRTGNAIATFEGPIGWSHRLVWASDGIRVTTFTKHNTVLLWGAGASTAIATLEGSTGLVRKMTWSPDGTRIATASNDGTARLWDGKTGDAIAILEGHIGLIFEVAWSPHSTRVATASHDGTVRLWDGRTGNAITVLKSATSFIDVAWSPDGTRIATTSNDGTARLWDGVTGNAIATLEGPTGLVREVVWALDSTRMATVGSDGAARLWDGRTGDAVTTLEGHTGPVLEVAWVPDGTRVATASKDGTARLWDGRTGDAIATLEGHTGPVLEVAWAPDGMRVATASNDGAARLWDGRTGDAIATLKSPPGSIYDVEWAPGGTHMATVTKDGTVRLWDGRTGDAIATLTGSIYCFAWSPDGTRVATASKDGTAGLWDGRTGDALITLKGHTASVFAVAWSPDGTRVATASNDGTVRLWPGTTEGWVARACEILEGSKTTHEIHEETKTICAAQPWAFK